eukprot:259046-Pyramimonas_sp.AAC.1
MRQSACAPPFVIFPQFHVKHDSRFHSQAFDFELEELAPYPHLSYEGAPLRSVSGPVQNDKDIILESSVKFDAVLSLHPSVCCEVLLNHIMEGCVADVPRAKQTHTSAPLYCP